MKEKQCTHSCCGDDMPKQETIREETGKNHTKEEKQISSPRCKDVMTQQVLTCEESASAAECAALMRKHNVGFVPVVDAEQRVVGVITDRDLAIRVLAQGQPAVSPVSKFMTAAPLVTCGPKDALKLAEQKMKSTGRSRVLVVDDCGHPVGVVGLTDVAASERKKRTGAVVSAVKSHSAAARQMPHISRT